MASSNQDTPETGQENVGVNAVIIVMDGYKGDWTPTAAMINREEANKLQSLLSEDAPAVCTIAPWYQTKEDVRENTSAKLPADLPNSISVCFHQDTALGVSTDDMVCREIQIKEQSGLRGKVGIYETAKEVAADNPTVTGKFIDALDNTAEDLIDQIE